MNLLVADTLENVIQSARAHEGRVAQALAAQVALRMAGSVARSASSQDPLGFGVHLGHCHRPCDGGVCAGGFCRRPGMVRIESIERNELGG